MKHNLYIFDWIKCAKIISDIRHKEEIDYVHVFTKLGAVANKIICYMNGKLDFVDVCFGGSNEPIHIIVYYKKDKTIEDTYDCSIYYKNLPDDYSYEQSYRDALKILKEEEKMKAGELVDIKVGNSVFKNCVICEMSTQRTTDIPHPTKHTIIFAHYGENTNRQEIKEIKSLPMIEIECEETADDKVKIKEVRNMLTTQELRSLSNEVYRIYITEKHMYRCDDEYIIYHPKYMGRYVLKIGTLFTKEKFNVLINVMKEIGERFMDIRKKVHEVETKNKTFVVQI